MFKHKNWPAGKAIANVCKYYTEVLEDEHKEDIYSLGKTRLKERVYGEIEGGIKLTVSN